MPAEERAPLILLLLGDLMLEERVAAAAHAAGLATRAVESPAELHAADGDQPAGVVLDLASSRFPLAATLAALEAAFGGRPPVLALYPHVRDDLAAAAHASGVELVVPRSRFARELPQLLQRLAGEHPPAQNHAAQLS